ncbi:50S ribosomal protein L9 [Pelagibius sp. Alg239-R121]|uniref:50S ribosomal protein L9 n=1 Tax=Pelagibius sp. Alg239-R121 TaxID=2993448 RepID=UPI0024A70B21|nr:50S ribosomal protein L9 [Pelagibius sp. Alg239-R121]
MEIILLERIEKLGQMGEVVSVKPGFARNYLLPQKKALRATKVNLEQFETQKAQLEAENLERKGEAEKVAEKMDGLSIIVIRQAGESGQLYGSVTNRDISDAVSEAGFTIDRKQVSLNAVIKTLGMHTVKVVLHPEVSVDVNVNVARSAEEAETQAETGSAFNAAELRDAEDAAVAREIAAEAAESRAEAESEDEGQSAVTDEEEAKA